MMDGAKFNSRDMQWRPFLKVDLIKLKLQVRLSMQSLHIGL